MYYSTDGKTWHKNGTTIVLPRSLYHANGLWVIGSFNKGLYYSVDGKSWV
nr:MAG TPA: hypothetical protein [Caudoviricetes sp.]